MNFLLKSGLKCAAFIGISIYCDYKRKNVSKTAYRKVGKQIQAAKRNHKFFDASAAYKLQRKKEQKKVRHVEKIKKTFKIF